MLTIIGARAPPKLLEQFLIWDPQCQYLKGHKVDTPFLFKQGFVPLSCSNRALFGLVIYQQGIKEHRWASYRCLSPLPPPPTHPDHAVSPLEILRVTQSGRPSLEA